MIGHVGTPGRGPYFIVALRLEGAIILEARFQTYGCGATIAAGSMLTEMVRMRPVAECFAIRAEDVIAALEGVPPNKLHGPALAIAALKDALNAVVDAGGVCARPSSSNQLE